MAQGCRDLIWECETKKINVFISTHVSKWEHCHCRLAGQTALGMISTAFPPRNRNTTDHRKDDGQSNRNKLGAADNSLVLELEYARSCFTL